LGADQARLARIFTDAFPVGPSPFPGEGDPVIPGCHVGLVCAVDKVVAVDANRLVVALSAVVSGRSAWLLLGVTGMAWSMGMAAAWAVVGYTVMELFLFLFAAPRIRRLTGRMKDITLTDFFISRLRGGHVLRVIVVTVIVLFMIAYVAANFRAGGTALTVASN
jgi:Na+/proline symporter